MRKLSGEEMLLLQIRAHGLPEPEREYRFAAHHVGLGPGIRERLREAGLGDWRFDFAWPDRMFAVEVEGGTWAQGRHVRGAGYARDCEKYNAAQELGFCLLRFTTGMVKRGAAIRAIERALRGTHGT